MTTDGEALDHGQLVGLLRAALEARAQRDHYARQFDNIARLFKGYLEAHPDEVLFDGESKIEARLQRREKPANYDTASMPWALIQALHEARLLSVSDACVKAITDQRLQDEARRFRQPGGETLALLIEEKK